MLTKLAALGSVLVGKTAVALGLRAKPAGWRRIVGVGLREEHAKFAVAAFGLKPPVGKSLAEALAEFLRNEADAGFRLVHTPELTARVPHPPGEVVELIRASNGEVVELQPVANGAGPEILETIRTDYNRLREASERERPWKMSNGKASEALRAATTLVVENGVPESERFALPDFRQARSLGDGHLAFVVRRFGDAIDVWCNVHHTGIDGAALQEMVNRLAAAWGTIAKQFPGPVEYLPTPASMPGEREVFQALGYYDFTAFLAARKRDLEAAGLASSGLPVGCYLMWRLTREPDFAKTKFGSTVDVAASPGHERDVDLVSIRPADFSDLKEFVRVYLERVELARQRLGPTRKACQTAELLSPKLHRKILEISPADVAETFGTLGLSVLKDSELFLAPYSDLGFPDGFLALGKIGLPSTSTGKIGAVTIKGSAERIERLRAALKRVLGK